MASNADIQKKNFKKRSVDIQKQRQSLPKTTVDEYGEAPTSSRKSSPRRSP